MLKASELRFGIKFLSCFGRIETVLTIMDNTDRGRIEYQSENHKLMYSHLIIPLECKNQYKPCEINPVPLTPALLEEYGFKKRSENGNIYDREYSVKSLNDNKVRLKTFCIAYYDGFIVSLITNHSHHKYLHELQNLYFSVTGKELTEPDVQGSDTSKTVSSRNTKTAVAYCTKCQAVTAQLDNTCYMICHACGTQNSLLNCDGTPHPHEQQGPAPVTVNITVGDNQTEVLLSVGSQFCPICNPHTWGNNIVQHATTKQQCIKCGYLWQTRDPKGGSFQPVKAYQHWPLEPAAFTTSQAREEAATHVVISETEIQELPKMKGPVLHNYRQSDMAGFAFNETQFNKDCAAYKSHVAALPKIQRADNGVWEIGQELTAGVDFERDYSTHTLAPAVPLPTAAVTEDWKERWLEWALRPDNISTAHDDAEWIERNLIQPKQKENAELKEDIDNLTNQVKALAAIKKGLETSLLNAISKATEEEIHDAFSAGMAYEMNSREGDGKAPNADEYIRSLKKRPVATEKQFQNRVQPWMMACFGEEISKDKVERNHRFLEEALELVQALDCTKSEALQLVEYVFNRPKGEPYQEAGGVMVTLAALCLANGLDMHDCGERELHRIWTLVDKIREKQAQKPKHSPLPQHTPIPSAKEEAVKIIDAWVEYAMGCANQNTSPLSLHEWVEKETGLPLKRTEQPTPTAPDLERLQAANKVFLKLVGLKKHKDQHGKTPYYQKEQPKAWEEAFAIVRGEGSILREEAFTMQDFEKGLMLAGLVAPANAQEAAEKKALNKFEAAAFLEDVSQRFYEWKEDYRNKRHKEPMAELVRDWYKQHAVTPLLQTIVALEASTVSLTSYNTVWHEVKSLQEKLAQAEDRNKQMLDFNQELAEERAAYKVKADILYIAEAAPILYRQLKHLYDQYSDDWTLPNQHDTEAALTLWEVQSEGKAAASQYPSIEHLLLVELAKAEYKSFGFSAVMLYKTTGAMAGQWSCKFRNEADNWKEAKEFHGTTPREALEQLYEYGLSKGYLQKTDSLPAEKRIDLSAYEKGFLLACQMVDDMYARTSTHPYMLGDCLLAKRGRIKSEDIKPNPHAPTPVVEAAKNVVIAWQVLKTGNSYKAYIIEEWLRNVMQPALDALSKALTPSTDPTPNNDL